MLTLRILRTLLNILLAVAYFVALTLLILAGVLLTNSISM